jgi:hypothetical protein
MGEELCWEAGVFTLYLSNALFDSEWNGAERWEKVFSEWLY